MRKIGILQGERRFIAGDPLRALAALAVLAQHVSYLVAAKRDGYAHPDVIFHKAEGRFIIALRLGVFVFFVLSGYLLARPFIRSFTNGTAQPDIGGYLRRRLWRIVPAFWVACVALLLIYGTQGATFAQLLAMFGFAQTYHPGNVNAWLGQAWTLDCEMLFYLLLPVVAYLLWRTIGRMQRGPARLLLISALFIVVGYIGYQLRWLGVPNGHHGDAPLGLLRAFLPGIGLAAFEVLAADKIRGKKWGPPVALLCVALGLGAVASCIWMSPDSLNTLWAGIVAGAFLVAGPLIMEWTTGRSWRVLDNRLLQWLGERSYGIYLLHAMVIAKMGFLVTQSAGPTSQWIIISVITAGITIFFASILYRLVEVPAMQIGRTGLWRRRGPAVVPAPQAEAATQTVT